MRAAPLLAFGAALALGACGKADTEPGPGGVTAGEARALDEAAQMIEDQRLTPDAIPSPGVPAAATGVPSSPAATGPNPAAKPAPKAAGK